MAAKRYKPEEIVGLLRRAEALNGQGMSMADASRQPQMIRVKFYGVNRGGIIGVTPSVSVRKVIESYESDVIQGWPWQIGDEADVDSRKPRFL